MASTVGMIVRTSKANERIDAALAVLAADSNVPAKPAKARDALLNDVLRLEWIATTLEALSGTADPAEMVEVPTDAELAADAAADAPTVTRKSRQRVSA